MSYWMNLIPVLGKLHKLKQKQHNHHNLKHNEFQPYTKDLKSMPVNHYKCN